MSLDCNASLSNVSTPDCNVKFGPVVGYILVPVGTEIADVATAKTLSTWTTLINAIEGSRAYVINMEAGRFLNGTTPSQDEPVYEDTAFGGVRTPIRDGNKRNVLMFKNLPVCMIKALRSLNNQRWEAFELTKNGYIRGYSPDGTKLQGFKILYHAGNEALPESADVGYAFSVYVDYYKPEQWDDSGIWALPTAFDIEDLEGIIDVELTEVSSATSSIVVDVKTKCGGVGVSGLVAGDFYAYQQDGGGDESIASISESTTVAGRYTLTPTASFSAEALYVKTKDQPDATTKGYETPTPLSTTPS